MQAINDSSLLSDTASARDVAVPVITYHSIDNSGSVISTAPKIFRRQIEHLSWAGYAGITLRELIETLKSGKGLPGKTVVLTFDDGFENFYTEAFPILNACNFKGTVFLVTDFCGGYNDWAGNPKGFPRTRLLSWKQVMELDGCGIEFGSHTRTHRDLTRMSSDRVQEELEGSKSAIADALGCPTDTFAYPFGTSNKMIREAVINNFEAACSTSLGKVSADSDLSRLHRIDSYYLSNQRLFELIPSTAFDNYIRVRQAMRTAKALIASR